MTLLGSSVPIVVFDLHHCTPGASQRTLQNSGCHRYHDTLCRRHQTLKLSLQRSSVCILLCIHNLSFEAKKAFSRWLNKVKNDEVMHHFFDPRKLMTDRTCASPGEMHQVDLCANICGHWSLGVIEIDMPQNIWTRQEKKCSLKSWMWIGNQQHGALKNAHWFLKAPWQPTFCVSKECLKYCLLRNAHAWPPSGAKRNLPKSLFKELQPPQSVETIDKVIFMYLYCFSWQTLLDSNFELLMIKLNEQTSEQLSHKKRNFRAKIHVHAVPDVIQFWPGLWVFCACGSYVCFYLLLAL